MSRDKYEASAPKDPMILGSMNRESVAAGTAADFDFIGTICAPAA